MTALWVGVVATCVGCFALKLAGFALPRRVVDHPAIRGAVELAPVSLLAALIAVGTFTTAQRLALDARAAGLAVAALLVVVRAPFLVIVVAAAGTAALLRALT
jgi:branched-subunit amino acid transport protein